ncbi:integral membrane sensor signal transduction histidine kinase [Flammeovirgaceae bacterium 311]|nr:integral membrane sensor signal transduction histidine kinase [Flammeovirgaceae bacterium 311]
MRLLPKFLYLQIKKQGLMLLAYACLLCLSLPAFAQHSLQDSSQVLKLAALGIKQFEKDSLEAAAHYFKESGTLARKIGYTRGIVQYIRDYILVLNRTGKYREALELTLEGVELSKQLGKADLSIAYNNVGLEYRNLGNLEAAATSYLKALEISEAIENKSLQRKQLNNLASIFLELRDADKAYTYASRSYQLAIQLKDTTGMASSLVNLANSETLNKRYEHSGRYFMQVIELGKALNDPSYILDAYINLADIEVQQQQYQQALDYYQKARQVLSTYPSPDYELYIHWGLSQNYYLLEQYDLAQLYYTKAVAIGQSMEALNELRHLYLLGSEIYEKKEDLLQALALRKQYETLKDSLLNTETRQNIQRLEIEYQISQKEKEIAQQNLIIARGSLEIQEKNNLIYLSLAAVIALISALIITYILFRNKQRANAEKLTALKRESEMKILMALMEGEEKERSRLARELHDGVGGILSATKMHLSLLKDEEQQPERFTKFNHTVLMLDNASQEIRTIAHNLSPDILMQYELDAALESFCQKVSNPNLQIDYYFLGEAPRLKNNFKLIIYRMVQELVNNIIKHANATHALVQLSYHEQVLSITVEDNGKGFTQTEGKGIGLQNLKNRINDIGGQLTIESSEGKGTTVYLEIEVSSFLDNQVFLSTAV